MTELRASLVCERIRAQVSAGLDEDLSQLERAMIASHLERCPPCAEYAAGVSFVTSALRQAPLEPLARAIAVHRARRPIHARLQGRAQVAAAAAAVVVGIVAGTQISGPDSLQLEPTFVPAGAAKVKLPSPKQLEIEQALLERAEVGNPVDLGGKVL